MNKNKIALLLSVCLFAMTSCADMQAESNDTPAMNMNETSPQETEITANNGSPENSQQPDDMPEEEEKPNEEIATENEIKASEFSTPAKLSDNLYDFQVSIDGTVYQFPMKYSDFESLGWVYDGDNADTLSANQYVARQQWTKDGFLIHTKLANLSTDTVTLSNSMVAGINIDRYMVQDCAWNIFLPGGIEWGVSNADDIKDAYGAPVSDYDGDCYYKMIYQDDFYREIDLYVYKDTNVLEQIDIENLFETRNTAVQAEIPNAENPE